MPPRNLRGTSPPTIGGVQAAPTSFRELTLAAFADRLASAEPVPGGGSASAVAASLGAGLVAMVASLSEGRPKYAAYVDEHARAKSAGEELVDRLLRIADEDAAAYAAFGAAGKLPKETEAEQALRGEALRTAARGAAEVPLRCVEACVEIVEVAELLAGRSNLNASSDLLVATLLAGAGAKGAAENVRVNLPSVGDDAWAAGADARVTELLERIEALSRATAALVRSRELRAPARPA